MPISSPRLASPISWGSPIPSPEPHLSACFFQTVPRSPIRRLPVLPRLRRSSGSQNPYHLAAHCPGVRRQSRCRSCSATRDHGTWPLVAASAQHPATTSRSASVSCCRRVRARCVWNFRDHSPGKDWRFLVKLSKNGAENSNHIARRQVGRAHSHAAVDEAPLCLLTSDHLPAVLSLGSQRVHLSLADSPTRPISSPTSFHGTLAYLLIGFGRIVALYHRSSTLYQIY
jgi:hypothetical protein